MTNPVVEDLWQRLRNMWAANPPNLPPATPTSLGGVKLQGDLGGTGDNPTVPGLAKKASLGADGKVLASQLPPSSGGGASSWDQLAGKPSTFPPAPHSHSIADTTGLQPALDKKADLGTDGKVLPSQLPTSSGGGVSSWNDLADKPTQFPPATHTHEIVYDGDTYNLDEITRYAVNGRERSENSVRADWGVPLDKYDEGGPWPPKPQHGDIYFDLSTLTLYRFEDLA